MIREEAKQAVEVLKAFADGKKIEYSDKGKDCWKLISEPEYVNFNFARYDYRVAKEPQYRPFENVDECWNEMLKHQPFGWIKHKGDGERIALTYLDDGHCFNDMFDKMTFADGEPLGVKID